MLLQRVSHHVVGDAANEHERRAVALSPNDRPLAARLARFENDPLPGEEKEPFIPAGVGIRADSRDEPRSLRLGRKESVGLRLAELLGSVA